MIGEAEVAPVVPDARLSLVEHRKVWPVDDVKETLQALLEAGAEAQQPISDVGGGKLIATVRDPDGNVMGFSKHLPAGSGPEKHRLPRS